MSPTLQNWLIGFVFVLLLGAAVKAGWLTPEAAATLPPPPQVAITIVDPEAVSIEAPVEAVETPPAVTPDPDNPAPVPSPDNFEPDPPEPDPDAPADV